MLTVRKKEVKIDALEITIGVSYGRGVFIVLALLFLILKVEAKDFGTLGQTFPIQEQSLKQVLMEKAESLSKSEIQQRSESLAKKAKVGRLFNKIPWIEEANQNRSFIYDPSTTLKEDIFDAEGRLLHSKGAQINPLDQVTLSSGLLFFDGGNPKHIEWAENQKGDFKWILVAGNPLKLQEEKDRPVFFDQGGIYSQKFKIQKVPCRISQSGNLLKIEEVCVREKSK